MAKGKNSGGVAGKTTTKAAASGGGGRGSGGNQVGTAPPGNKDGSTPSPNGSLACIRLVELAKLECDTSYQREQKHKVGRMQASYRMEAAMVLCVAERKDGSMWIVDGLQRKVAACNANITHLPAYVFPSAGPEQEAEIFVMINLDRVKMQPIEEFKSLVVKGDPQALGVKSVAESVGLQVAIHRNQQDAKGYVSCVRTLLQLHRVYGPEALRFGLMVPARLWLEDRYAFQADMITGLVMFRQGLLSVSVPLDEARLLDKLSRCCPSRILGEARQLRGAQRVATWIAQKIGTVYDPSNKLNINWFNRGYARVKPDDPLGKVTVSVVD